VTDKKVAVLGGGAVAADCATTAKRRGALSVELIYRRKLENMPLTAYERDMLLEHGVEIATCSKPLEVAHKGKRVIGLRIARMMLRKGKAPRPENFILNRKESPVFREFDMVISAIGSRSRMPIKKTKGVFYAGDMILGSATVVEPSPPERTPRWRRMPTSRARSPRASRTALKATQSWKAWSSARCPSTRSSSAAGYGRLSFSLRHRTPTVTRRCARPMSAAGPAG